MMAGSGRIQNRELFEDMPVGKAVLSLSLPMVASQLITIFYNMADTFFVGHLNDANQVAAASLSMPLFVLINCFGSLFGVGGSSLISRSLGSHDIEQAKRTASFCIWNVLVFAAAYGVIIYVFRPAILPSVGANEGTYEYCSQYLFWTVTVGAIPTMFNSVVNNLIRAEGYSKQASYGLAFGGILNMVLDPIFIFALKLEIEGAAIATMLSSLSTTVYFLFLLHKKKAVTVISLNIRYYSFNGGIPKEVILVGLPSGLTNLINTLSNLVLNRIVSSYSNAAIAGIGIAKKIDMVVFAVTMGFTSGVMPLIGYNYAAKNRERMKESIKTVMLYSVGIAILGTISLFALAKPVIQLFIKDTLTVQYGQAFQKILILSAPLATSTMLIGSVFQATGAKKQPIFLSVLRKGGIYIPVLFLMNSIFGFNGIAWATTISDALTIIIAVLLFLPSAHRLFLTNDNIEKL